MRIEGPCSMIQPKIRALERAHRDPREKGQGTEKGREDEDDLGEVKPVFVDPSAEKVNTS